MSLISDLECRISDNTRCDFGFEIWDFGVQNQYDFGFGMSDFGVRDIQ